jgi:hypothetical protein
MLPFAYFVSRHHKIVQSVLAMHWAGFCGGHFKKKEIGKGSVAKFLVPDWGDKVNSGAGLSYLPARLHWPAGQYDNHARVNFINQSGTMNSATGAKYTRKNLLNFDYFNSPQPQTLTIYTSLSVFFCVITGSKQRKIS